MALTAKFNPFTVQLDWVNDLYKGALSSAPSNPSDGWMYFNTTDSTLYVYYGGWIAIGSGTPTTSHLLMENGDNFALENGDILTLE